jgi:MOSC domain-containing protein YiiM
MQVTNLFISPGHNFFGHHGQPAGEHPVVAVEQIECVAGRGIRGDRFFNRSPDYKGQITFFDMAVFQALEHELELNGARPELTRRNVFTRGVDLNELVAVEFEVQGIRFAGVEECRPCYWMNHAFQDERVEAWLQGRGGLRARILSNGVLTCADQWHWHGVRNISEDMLSRCHLAN